MTLNLRWYRNVLEMYTAQFLMPVYRLSNGKTLDRARRCKASNASRQSLLRWHHDTHLVDWEHQHICSEWDRQTCRLLVTQQMAVSYLSCIISKTLPRLWLSSSRSDQNIGRRVVSIWHGRWQYLLHHSSQHPVCPDPPSVCLAMSSLVFRPSSCHLLVSTLWPD